MPASSILHHDDLLVLDSHIDIPWPDQPGSFLDSVSTKRQVTLAGMKEGKMDAGCFVAFTPQGRLDLQAHDAAWNRVCKMLDVIAEMEASSEGDAWICATPEAVKNAKNNGKKAIIPVVENVYPIGEHLERLDYFAKKHVAYITLTHNGHNLVADSSVFRASFAEEEQLHHGLSAFGHEVIQRMNRLGIMVDVSHVSKSSMEQAVKHSVTPVIASHSCIKSLCDHRRNMDDSQLDLLKESGGVIQITALDAFLKKGATQHNPASLEDILAHIVYAVNRIGIEHVGISSDFEGGGGINGWQNAAQTSAVTQALYKYGFDASEIQALWGGNFLTLWQKSISHACSLQKS